LWVRPKPTPKIHEKGHKYYTSHERLAREQHASLFFPESETNKKTFATLEPMAIAIKLFTGIMYTTIGITSCEIRC
jgi:hypothetical protein